ncbi:MAG: deoxynucleoside kinase [Trueperaceae bacterium]|nr:deoxynucleoside kinase [Trueperaceae bacterium]
MANIVVEGPIGVGKTSLTKLLADAIGARQVLEVVEENPFLAAFYQDPERYAFSTQSFFLLSRFKQSQELGQGSLFARHVVADYLFDKDWIFASLTLQGDEWELYQDLYRSLRPKLAPPDLVVYLRADPDVLLPRIAQRARPFERNMDPDYLRRLGSAYDAWFEHCPYPLHVIEASDVDFVASPADRDAVLADVLQLAKVA